MAGGFGCGKRIRSARLAALWHASSSLPTLRMRGKLADSVEGGRSAANERPPSPSLPLFTGPGTASPVPSWHDSTTAAANRSGGDHRVAAWRLKDAATGSIAGRPSPSSRTICHAERKLDAEQPADQEP